MNIEEVGFLFMLCVVASMVYLTYLFIVGVSALNRVPYDTDREMYPDCDYPLDNES